MRLGREWKAVLGRLAGCTSGVCQLLRCLVCEELMCIRREEMQPRWMLSRVGKWEERCAGV